MQTFSLVKNKNNKSVALQFRKAKTDWSGCCQMTVQGALWLVKRLSLDLNFSFLNRISLLLISSSYQLSSRGWVEPIPDPILPEKILWYSRGSNPGPLGWQSDVLTTIPNRRSFSLVSCGNPQIPRRKDMYLIHKVLSTHTHLFAITPHLFCKIMAPSRQ